MELCYTNVLTTAVALGCRSVVRKPRTHTHTHANVSSLSLSVSVSPFLSGVSCWMRGQAVPILGGGDDNFPYVAAASIATKAVRQWLELNYNKVRRPPPLSNSTNAHETHTAGCACRWTWCCWSLSRSPPA